MANRPEHLFSVPYAPPDETVAEALLVGASRAEVAEQRIDRRARRLIQGIRAKIGGLGGVDDFLHAYSLSTKEGLALMVLAEALLRVPDAATAERPIEEALARAKAHPQFSYSFDMLGEGARTSADAENYFAAYAGAIAAIGADGGNKHPRVQPGISVKLSALHPRYEAILRERVREELTPRLIELAELAKAHDLQFTVDAEEADRLELSLEVIAAALSDGALGGWDGFGLAVQAYQKRALALIDWVEEVAAAI